MNNKELIQKNQPCQTDEERAVYYMLLSRLFTDQTISADIDGYLEILAPYADADSGLAAPFMRNLESWQKKDQADHLLKTEYARVFILAGGVRPYESIYRGEGNMLMQEPWVKVKQFYHNCGLKLENPAGHPEDHASAEFSFMFYLLGKEELSAAEDFFRQHIVCWIPQMLNQLLDYPYADFFKDVASFGLSFIESESAYLSAGNVETLITSDQLQGSDN